MRPALLPLLLLAASALALQLSPGSCYTYFNLTISSAPAYLIAYNYNSTFLSAYLMTPQQVSAFVNGQSVSPLASYQLPPYSPSAFEVNQTGNYNLVVYPVPCSQRLLLYLSSPRGGLPVGIASYPAELLSTQEVAGFFNITSISAYNPNFNPSDGASLQLNAVVQVRLADGSTQYYWVQDIAWFETSRGQVNFGDNVWNSTSPSSSVSPSSISGQGSVNNGVYLYGTYLQPYALPLAGFLAVRAYAANGAVHVDFGYLIAQNGAQLSQSGATWFDHVTITPSQPAVSVQIVVTTTFPTSGGNAPDVELVFGGIGNGEITTFNSLRASLGLYYLNGSSWVPLPYLYTYGADTAEGATDLATSWGNGLASVAVGPLSPGRLSPTCVQTPQSLSSPVQWSLYCYASVKYPVSITSPIPIYVNGTETTSYSAYLPAGAALVIQDGYARYPNGTMFVPSVGNETIVVSGPISLAVSWTPYYLVRVSSPIPVEVDGQSATYFSTYIKAGSSLVVQAREVYLPNGTMLRPAPSYLSLTVEGPLNITVSWSKYYELYVKSAFPVYVNGSSAAGPVYLPAGSLAVVTAYNVTLPNGTMFVPSPPSAVVDMSGPVVLEVDWAPLYLVSISSPLPVLINGTAAESFSKYLRPGSRLALQTSNVVLPNGTMFVPNVGNSTVTVSAPLAISVEWTPYYLVRVESPLPVLINGTAAASAYVRRGSLVYIRAVNITLPNGTMFVPSVGNETLAVTAPLTISVEWTPYYLVAVRSPLPVLVNGTASVDYERYLRAGSRLVVSAGPARVGNGTMFVPAQPNATLLVAGPVNYTVGWIPYYLVEVESSEPVYVNGTATVNYTEYVRAGSALYVAARAIYLRNGSALFPSPGNLTLIVRRPVQLAVSWRVYHLVSVSSPLPVLVNGSRAQSLYVPAGSVVVVSAHRVVLPNGTMFVPSVGNETIVVEGALNIAVSWTPYYLVEVYSPLPVFVNGTAATRYAQYVRAGSALALGAPQRVVFDNGTMFVPAVGNETVVVSAPARLAVSWIPYYLVQISGQRPVLVNGVSTASYEQYLRRGSSLSISAEPVPEFGGLIVLEPNVTRMNITVERPIKVGVVYAPDYSRLEAVAAAASAASAAASLILRRRRAVA
ncbi:thermopsin family protease [Thermoproteus tenax]|uniref:Thermopsin n=1 Tax=Thermoproteus tenax (strain ATCC 35583 / DSM 2078 / JCM 9277 / NBRC 100435 / Kra 1) TaxID=768679 RepID=G4RK32_THETK|nr:thermopsin family protease [Thermoproteus tenax]CCC81927.1 thermopsin [Thermoproteus tenax Kra 1]